MNFFGVLFIVSTTLVFFLKKETEDSSGEHNEDLSVRETYKQMWKMVFLGPVQTLVIILMTVKVILKF